MVFLDLQASLRACRPAAPSAQRCGCRPRWKTPPSWPSCVIAATGARPPVCANLVKSVQPCGVCTTHLHSWSGFLSYKRVFRSKWQPPHHTSCCTQNRRPPAPLRHTWSPSIISGFLAEVALVCTLRYLSTGVFSEATAARDPGPCTVEEFPSATARLLFFPSPHLVVFRADDDPNTGAVALLQRVMLGVLGCQLSVSKWQGQEGAVVCKP